MIRGFRFSLVLMSLLASFVWADEQQKVQKILNQVTAMATDAAGRRAVSLAVSDSLSVSRAELARQRSAMGVNYGELFLAYQLIKSGAKMNDIVAQTKNGKTVWQIAEAQNANWKEIASEVKKLNNRLDVNLLKHFANRKTDAERDRADGYDPFLDSVNADRNVTQQDIEDAQKRYMFLRDHAGVTSGGTLDTATEKAARTVRTDPIRNGGPDTQTRPTPRN
jgi:hypothetical protein